MSLYIDCQIEGTPFTQIIVTRHVELIGTVTLQVEGDFASVSRFFVHPDYRRQGVGARLLQDAIMLARDRGATRMNLTVALRFLEGLKPFYEKRGFEAVFQLSDGDVLFTRAL